MTTDPPTTDPVEEEWMLCPCCFHQNVPEVAFCKDCGAPLGPFVGLDPIQHIYLEGFAYRRATGRPPSWRVLVGFWLIYFPAFACCLVVSAACFTPSPANAIDLGVLLIAALYTGTFLYQTTANYVRKAKALKLDPSSEETSHTP